jgi:hypothetical protein
MERIHDFAGVSWREGYLHGERARFRIKLNSEADSEELQVVYDDIGKEVVDRTVWFVGGQEIVDDQYEMIEESDVRIFHPGPCVTLVRMRFEEYTEYRLMDARRCRRGCTCGARNPR